VIVTNMGEARNAIIVWSANAVIAIADPWVPSPKSPSPNAAPGCGAFHFG
jgi:hypothetical protein